MYSPFVRLATINRWRNGQNAVDYGHQNDISNYSHTLFSVIICNMSSGWRRIICCSNIVHAALMFWHEYNFVCLIKDVFECTCSFTHSYYWNTLINPLNVFSYHFELMTHQNVYSEQYDWELKLELSAHAFLIIIYQRHQQL